VGLDPHTPPGGKAKGSEMEVMLEMERVEEAQRGREREH